MKGVRGALLRWYGKAARDLPWRRVKDPYSVWVAETMLQQTQVETVIPYYQRFMARFPDVFALAEAAPDEVMQRFAGLGYYARARSMHAAAQQVVRECAGEFPNTAEALQRLPGIGRYTAGAVASIAFGRRAPVLDGNVVRVLTRLLDLREDVRQPAVQRRLWQVAEELVQGARPGDLNQALMELGAMLCTRSRPNCPACPLRTRCAAHARGNPETLPLRGPALRKKAMRAAAVLFTRRGAVLMMRRPPQGLLGGTWDLPGGEISAREAVARGAARVLHECSGLTPRRLEALGVVRHVFTHRTLRLHVFRASAPPGRVRRSGFDAHRWCARSALPGLPLSALARKSLALALPGIADRL